ncbi:hypothetical protein AGLY_009033 [Aphis glycines]|uniref:Uncharacterized protein n=1 Tax=Aphis glycines TaxID=307491 RepID=A0A6G0TIT6_APHGL|nr:hypothetical protein AGLY_009033 [Aphis glycines]
MHQGYSLFHRKSPPKFEIEALFQLVMLYTDQKTKKKNKKTYINEKKIDQSYSHIFIVPNRIRIFKIKPTFIFVPERYIKIKMNIKCICQLNIKIEGMNLSSTTVPSTLALVKAKRAYLDNNEYDSQYFYRIKIPEFTFSQMVENFCYNDENYYSVHKTCLKNLIGLKNKK